MATDVRAHSAIDSLERQVASLWRLTAKQSEQIGALNNLTKMLLNMQATGSIIPPEDKPVSGRPLPGQELAEMRLKVFISQLEFYRTAPAAAKTCLNSSSVIEIEDYLKKRSADV
jgi:hypothetical protein